MIKRVTTFLELVGLLLLTTAVAVGIYHRWGLEFALAAAGLLCLAWSFIVYAVHSIGPSIDEGEAL